MKSKTRKKQKNKIFLLLAIFGIVIGFAYITSEMSIFGTANIKAKKVNVHWENEKLLDNSVDALLELNEERDTISYNVNFKQPGEVLAFTVDAKNDSVAKAEIKEISTIIYNSEGEEIELPEYLEYNVKNKYSTKIDKSKILVPQEKITYEVTLKYKKGVEIEEDSHIRFEMKIDYAATDREPLYTGILCKRANSKYLHEEYCYSQSCQQSHPDSESITYGNKKVKKGKLNSGDAFTCDVNGDGSYDEYYERFYYISDYYDTEIQSINSEIATLVYFNNYAYDNYGDSDNDYSNNFMYYYYYPDSRVPFRYSDDSSYRSGPNIAFKALPNIFEWINLDTNLDTSKGRNIFSSSSELVTYFEYQYKAARLLSIKELALGCNLSINEYTEPSNNNLNLSECEYLLENTVYSSSGLKGWWLENPHRTSDRFWAVDGDRVSLYTGDRYNNYDYGVRPVIDVPKDRIKY